MEPVVDYTFLQALWFVLIAVLWIAFFVLEGFDFGVGMLIRAVGKSEADRRAIIHSIGPMWDGNEVWLVTAGGATFAAFPFWYATMFSGFYLAFFFVLVALIVRGVSFEFWGKKPDSRWRTGWEWAMALSSMAASFLFGVAWANIFRGVPINGEQNFTGDLFTLLNPYALLGGVAVVLIFIAHGAVFLSLRTGGDLPARATAIARIASPAAALATLAFMVWTMADSDWAPEVIVLGALAAALLAGVALAKRAGRSGIAFGFSAGAIVAFFATIFVGLFPNVMPSSISPLFDLTIANASSSKMTLTLMAIVAAVMLPIVLAYTAWAYWVFRKRVSPEQFDLTTKNPIDLVRGSRGGADGPGAPAAG